MPVLPPPAPGVRARPPSPPGGRRRRLWPVIVLAGLVSLLAGLVGVFVGAALDDDEGGDATNVTETSTARTVATSPTGRLPVRAVAESVGPSIVTISADVANGRSVGTGVVVSAEGEILTNAHVVNEATEIRVRLPGETEPIVAELVASDVGNDLALLEIDRDALVPVTFADSEAVGLGDEVVAIGFALDLDGEPTVTLGIVSALDRTIITERGEALDGLIQTDAAISSGNSGGPLVDVSGRIVGINTAVARSDVVTAATNVGFAISSNEVESVLESLRDASGGSPRREGFLGISLDDRTDGGQGAVVTDVTEGSPAADAGIERRRRHRVHRRRGDRRPGRRDRGDPRPRTGRRGGGRRRPRRRGGDVHRRPRRARRRLTRSAFWPIGTRSAATTAAWTECVPRRRCPRPADTASIPSLCPGPVPVAARNTSQPMSVCAWRRSSGTARRQLISMLRRPPPRSILHASRRNSRNGNHSDRRREGRHEPEVGR